MRFFKKFFLFCLIGILAQRFCLKQTDEFSLGKIRSHLPYHPQWATKDIKEPKQAFEQPYFYLGKGAQNFAFISEDKNYVLKFYRHHRVNHPLLFLKPYLPHALKQKLSKTLLKRKNKRIKDFTSYQLAYQALPEETGLLYLHLNKTDHLNTTLTLYDKIGIRHQIELDKMEFILQKKANLVYPTLEMWIENKETYKAKEALSRLIEILRSRCMQGLSDKDPDLSTNFGFIDTTPIQFDMGRFKIDASKKDPTVYRDELIKITDRLCNWLNIRAPELSDHIQQEIKKS